MKYKNFKAIVIDQDPASSEQMKSYVESIFKSTYVQNLTAEVERDCMNLKPDVVFLNLTIAQREASFSFLEKIFPKMDPTPNVFGYTDRNDPELIAHAIENGVNDVFARPYDGDIIATKVSRFVQNEETISRDLQYTRIYKPFKGEVHFTFKLMSVDENGMTFFGGNFISKGTKFTLMDPLIRDIFGETPVPLMITKTWLGENDNEYFFYVEPRDSTEVTSAALRRFILSKL